MKYGSKVLIVLLILLFCEELISYLFNSSSLNQLVYKQMGQRALAVASSTAALLDPEKLRLIRQRSDENRPEYKELLEQLRKIRDANRNSGIDIGFLYTIHLSTENPNILLYGLDPEERFNFKSYPGDVVHGMLATDIPFEDPHIHPDFRTDEWGSWLIARYPVKDSQGKIVALVAADIKKSEVIKENSLGTDATIHTVLLQCLIGLIGGLLISLSLSSILTKIKTGIAKIDAGQLPVRIDLKNKDEFGSLARSIEKMSDGLAERDLIKSAFARYVSKQVADSIIGAGVSPVIHGERRRITILFCDIRDFTSISEKLPPEDVVQLLNSYFEIMVDVIFKHKGMLDKFMGDGLMAIFGAPLEDPYQEENALRAAIEMRKQLTNLNLKVREKFNVDLSIGIGINSGLAIIGNVGSTERMEYTAIGDTVNLASRLEAKTRDLQTEILISEYTYNSVRSVTGFVFENKGSLSIKGKKDQVNAYAVSGR